MIAERITDLLRTDGFVRVDAGTTAAALDETARVAWQDFAADWDGMPLDGFMADGGRYRRRRHAVLSTAPNLPGLRREADAPHWQARTHNHLNGGVQRRFEPMRPEATAHPAFQAVAGLARSAFDAAEPGCAWQIEAHQFRIEARPDAEGRPTPEGMHRDGVEWVLVMLVRRENIAEGVTEIATPEGRRLGAFTLAEPLDMVLLDDRRVLHGVTPIRPLDPARPAWRDVLVVTFRCASISPAMGHAS